MEVIGIENDKKKEYLKSYKQAIAAEKTIEKEIEQLRLDKMCPSILQDGMPHSSRCGDLSGYVAMVDELLEEQRQSMEKRISLRREIIQRIEQMDNETEKMVLRMRYIHMMGWEKISEELNYAYRWTLKLHNKALNHFQI